MITAVLCLGRFDSWHDGRHSDLAYMADATARQQMDDARNRQVTCAHRGWTRSVPLLRWLRQEFRADRGRGVLFAHVLEDSQGFLEPGPCLGFAAEFA